MYTKALTAVHAILLTTLATSVSCLSHSHFHSHKHEHEHLSKRATTPMVFAHYMIQFQPPGLDGSEGPDYSTDINMAKAAGFDAFAVDYTDNAAIFAQNLEIFYQNASNLDFKLFLTIDTTTMFDVAQVVNITNTYADSPAQAKDAAGNIFLSSFEVNPPAWNWQTDVIDKIKVPVTLLPGSLGESGSYETSLPDRGAGPFTWVHPALSATEEAAVDQSFAAARNSTGKPWMAGIAPWFFKRLSSDTNWLNAQDSNIYIDRWVSLLKLKPDYIEVISWNDFGESHYIGPADSTPESQLMEPTKADYYGNLDHSGFLKMSTIFIKTFKAGETVVSVSADEEDVFFFYRPQTRQQHPHRRHLPRQLVALTRERLQHRGQRLRRAFPLRASDHLPRLWRVQHLHERALVPQQGCDLFQLPGQDGRAESDRQSAHQRADVQQDRYPNHQRRE